MITTTASEEVHRISITRSNKLNTFLPTARQSATFQSIAAASSGDNVAETL